MTWCARIYDIFNVWNLEENGSLPSITPKREQDEASSISENNNELSQDTPVNELDATIIQHDSPFLEKSDSLINTQLQNEQLPNKDAMNGRDYQGEHFCVDPHFSCHQLDGQYYYNPEHRHYGIATISNMSLNLSPYLGNIENIHQKLPRSISLDIPMHLKQSYFKEPSFREISQSVRYSTNQPIHRPYTDIEKPNRLSLNLGSRTTDQAAFPKQQDSLGYRVSSRSSYSVADNETSESQSRNSEQIERLIQYNIKEMLASSPGGVFPMIYRLPESEMFYGTDHYRVEGGYGEASQWCLQTKILPYDCCLISDNIASIYSNDFNEQYHVNLFAIDADSNPVIMSVKPYEQKLKVIVRTKEGSKCMDFVEKTTNSTDYVYLSKQVFPNLKIVSFETCTNLKAQELIQAYDNKLETQKFKFGVIYQRRGQTTEEEFFNNQNPKESFDEFLQIIASRVTLKNFKGYRGGLDVSEQTDSPISYYECYEQKEIMFHVSTLLPYTPNDMTQIQRKRHIGNDIVAIVFQEDNTPFHPSMIKSNFLHAFLVVQPVQILSKACYKIMLVVRDDIEPFPPYLQKNVVYVRTAEQLKPFILSKLINAEYAAYRCKTFSLLQERTRYSYLRTLCEDLAEKDYETLRDEQRRLSHRRLSLLSTSTRKRLSSVKKIFSKSNSTQDSSRQSIKSEQGRHKSSKKLSRMGKSMDIVSNHQSFLGTMSSPDQDLPQDNILLHRHVNARSDESLNSSSDVTSSTLQHHSFTSKYNPYGDESDEGLDSMSSADTVRMPYDSDDQETYRRQILEKSQAPPVYHRVSAQRQIYTPQTAGIHISEEASV